MPLLRIPSCHDSIRATQVQDRKQRHPTLSVASRPLLRFTALAPDSTVNSEAAARRCRALTGHPALASETLVCGLGGPVDFATMDNTAEAGSVQPGGHRPPRSTVAPIDRLALERLQLRKDRLSNEVISVIQSVRLPSTTTIYEASWRAFSTWCLSHHVDPTSADILDVLNFLHDGLAKGLALATLPRQVAALSTVLMCDRHRTLSQNPRIRSFLHGATNISPPVVHWYPSWDLPLVLQTLTSPPFEPLASISLKFLTLKVTFLLAITSARHVSELTALSIRKDLCIFYNDRVVMRLDPTFLPKVNSWFHRAQELVLPNFCPNPRHPSESLWHMLDIRRALRRYIKHTKSFRQTEALSPSILL